LYYVDIGCGSVDWFEFDLVIGVVVGCVMFVYVLLFEGLFDGFIVDVDGYLWFVFWGGGCVCWYVLDGLFE